MHESETVNGIEFDPKGRIVLQYWDSDETHGKPVALLMRWGINGSRRPSVRRRRKRRPPRDPITAPPVTSSASESHEDTSNGCRPRRSPYADGRSGCGRYQYSHTAILLTV